MYVLKTSAKSANKYLTCFVNSQVVLKKALPFTPAKNGMKIDQGLTCSSLY